MTPMDDMIGKKFGRLLVLESAGVNARQQRIYLCICDCAATRIAIGAELRRMHGVSCGCLQKDRASQANRTHGKSRSPMYAVWRAMHQRCNDSKHPLWHRYGQRGIKVCERWKSFQNFYADMGERPLGMSIDRYPDMNGDYEPNNCRWATKEQQANNTSTNRILKIDGKEITASRLARSLGMPVSTIYTWLHRGVFDSKMAQRLTASATSVNGRNLG